MFLLKVAVISYIIGILLVAVAIITGKTGWLAISASFIAVCLYLNCRVDFDTQSIIILVLGGIIIALEMSGVIYEITKR